MPGSERCDLLKEPLSEADSGPICLEQVDA